MSELALRGLDGSNPLGFMAALGVLAALDERRQDPRMRWLHDGVWHPALTTPTGPDLEALIAEISEDQLGCRHEPALALEYGGVRDLKPEPPVYRSHLQSLVLDCSPERRRSVDWVASFASDVVVDRSGGRVKPTALHFTAGQQEFLRMVRDLAEGVTPDDLREALEGPWRYKRALPVLGWDATAGRDYALRASNPSTDKKLGTPGADWLAARGLTLLPSFPAGNRLATTGCSGGWKTGRFSWPLWTTPLSTVVVRTVLQRAWAEDPATVRVARGIGAVFVSGIRRSDQGGYGSFEPSQPI